MSFPQHEMVSRTCFGSSSDPPWAAHTTHLCEMKVQNYNDKSRIIQVGRDFRGHPVQPTSQSWASFKVA